MELFQDSSIWLLFSFVIFAVVCVKFLKAPLLAMIDARISIIQKELETSESLRIEAQELLAQYQRKHKDSLQEAKDIVSQAEKHAIQIRKEAEKQLAENIALREKQLKERLKRMEKSAVNDIRAYASEIAVEATRQLIREELGKKDDTRLQDESISQIAKYLH